jgi:hypothetical protein
VSPIRKIRKKRDQSSTRFLVSQAMMIATRVRPTAGTMSEETDLRPFSVKGSARISLAISAS